MDSRPELAGIVGALQKFYGALPSPPRDPFTLFVWEVLSVHSTPRKRDAALAALRRIPALTPDAMWRAPQKKLEDSVKLAGPYTEQRLMNMAEITGGTPYGATTLAGIDGSRQPSESELAIARFQGRHVTQITNALIAGRTSKS